MDVRFQMPTDISFEHLERVPDPVAEDLQLKLPFKAAACARLSYLVGHP